MTEASGKLRGGAARSVEILFFFIVLLHERSSLFSPLSAKSTHLEH